MLTDQQGYYVTHLFLDKLWISRKQEYDDDLPAMLGSMSLLSDGMPVDQAHWSHWKDYAPEQTLTADDAFYCMIAFLDAYRKLGEGDTHDISRVIAWIDSAPDEMKDSWMQCVQEVIHPDFDAVERLGLRFV